MARLGSATESSEAPFLSTALRIAFGDAARDDAKWQQAKADPDRYLKARGVLPSEEYSVAFLDVEREGDTVASWARRSSASSRCTARLPRRGGAGHGG